MTNHGLTWEEEEVELLLSIWGDEKIQRELDGPKQKQNITSRERLQPG